MSIDVVITQTADRAEGNNLYPAMATGLHAAVIREVKDLGTKTFNGKTRESYVAEFVNAKGESASRFYSPSLFPGNAKTGPSNLAADLKELDGAVPESFAFRSLKGRQVQVLVTQGTNAKGYPSSKVVQVLKPTPGQSVSA
jgi:hypothetical protein